MQSSPENIAPVRADVVVATEGSLRTPRCPGVAGLTGVLEHGMHTRIPQEPGRSRSLHGKKLDREPAEFRAGKDAPLLSLH